MKMTSDDRFLTTTDNDDGKPITGITEEDFRTGEHDSVCVDVEYLRWFVNQIEEMGWDQVTLHTAMNQPLVAHPLGDDFGVYAVLAPWIREDEDE